MSVIINNPALRVSDVSTRVPAKPEQAAAAPAPSFNEIFNVQFSKHAHMRLNARNINLTGEQMERVENGIVRANEKGIRDSLVLVDDLALVVNVRSRTVITALQHGNEQVFSNIDGAVIV